MHLLSIRTTTSWKMLMNNKFKAQTLTGNPAGNLRRHVLVSHALNMSCSFGQSACSIESRCMVIGLIWPEWYGCSITCQWLNGKKDVTPLLTYWSSISFARSHCWVVSAVEFCLLVLKHRHILFSLLMMWRQEVKKGMIVHKNES